MDDQKLKANSNDNDNRGEPTGPGGNVGPGGRGGPGMPNRSFFGRWGPILLLIGLLVLPWILPLFSGGGGNEISYTEFLDQVSNGNVQSVTIVGSQVQGTLAGGGEDQDQANQFVTYIPTEAPENLRSRLRGQNVQVFARPPRDGNFLTNIIWLLPLIFFGWIFYQYYRRMRGGGGGGGGMFNVGQNKAKRQKSEDVDTTFGDVAGIESAKNELKEIVEYLKHPKKFEDLGAKTPTGVLLVGPPGTGKTLLARAVAGEADVPFFSISGSDFMEMFVGVGASRVRNLFKDAKKKSPCIIFIDELDSIGRSRGAGLGGGHDEREQTLNQLLSELDGFEKKENVVVLAGTNRPDILDKALLRPGRFDRRVTTHLPTMADRKLILELHAKEKSIADDVDLEKVARNTPGFSGADLSNLLNEAALQAAREGKEEMDQQSVDTARDKILLGLERKGVALSDHDKKVLAYHEAGHAVVSALMENAEPVHKVTIIPRENSMGVTQQLPERDRFLYEKAYLEDRLTVMMGGRASEQYKMSTLTSGAENDLKQAQQLARKMVLDWGMSERYANVAHGGERKAVFLGEDIGQQRDYSDQTAYQIDEQIEKILTEAYDRARSTLEENEKGLEKLAEALLDREEVPGSEVYELLGIARED